ncbi:MAG: hypothetical protein E7E21_01435 [Peptostreptococcaceae bacterium]|nr:hypothetical protein [Peptostreptococcaceae bacterium]
MFSKEEFENFLISEDNTVLPEQQEVLNTISEKLSLIPFESPYEYVKELQAKFDYTKLIFTDEYYDVLGIDRR